jgi:hypothetical protein
MFQVRHVKICAGTQKQAFEATLLDRYQYRVRVIHTYRVDPDVRATMEFYTEWEDSIKLWKVWCNAEDHVPCNLTVREDTSQPTTIKVVCNAHQHTHGQPH